MTDDTQKRPEQLEAEIEQSRARIGSAVDAIQAKLSPGQIIDQVVGQMRGSGNGASQFGSNLATTVRDNPIPTALVGIGLAWLMFGGSSSNNGKRRGRYENRVISNTSSQSPYYEDMEYRYGDGEYRYGNGSTNTDDQNPYYEDMEYRYGGGFTEVHADDGANEEDRNRIGAAAEGVRRSAGDTATRIGASAASARDRINTASAQTRDGIANTGARTRDSIADAGARTRDSIAGAGARAQHAAAQSRERISAASAGARAKLNEALGIAQTRAGEATESTRRYSNQLGYKARYQAKRAKQGFSYMLEEQPLLLAGVGLAIGAALGAGLPPTRQEDELMGETRDEMLTRTRIMAEDQYHRSQAIVTAAIDSARGEAERQHMTPNDGEGAVQSIQEKIQRVAQQAMGAAVQEVKRQNMTPEAGESALREVKDKLTHIAQAAWDGAKKETDQQGATSAKSS